MKKFTSLIILLVCFFCFTQTSWAINSSIEAATFRPASDNGNYFGIWSSDGLGVGEWRVGTFLSYDYRPFQLVVNGNRAQGIVDHLFVEHFTGSVGLFDQQIALGVDVPMGWWVDFLNPNFAGATATDNTVIGDIRVNLKGTLFHSHWGDLGVAVVPFIDLPSGNSDVFFGKGVVGYGGLVVVDAKPMSGFKFSFNFGLAGQEEYNFRDIEKNGQLLLGLGTQINLSHTITLNTEIHSQTRLSDLYAEDVESPTEVLAGFKWKIADSGFTLSAGGGAGILHGAGAPQYRAFTGLSYTPTH